MAAYLPNIIHTVKTTNGTFHEYQNIEVLEEIFLHLRASQYTLIAGAVIYLYDIFMTLDEEITLIWSRNARKGLFMKILFALVSVTYFLLTGPSCDAEATHQRTDIYHSVLFLSQYSFTIQSASRQLLQSCMSRSKSLISHHPYQLDRCRHFFLILTICHGLGAMIATTVFATRLFTVFDGNRGTQILLLCTLTFSHLSLIAVIVAVCIQAIPTIFYSPDARVCAGTPVPAVGGMYITPIFVESVVAAMTLLHAIQFNKNRNEHCSVMPVINRLYLNGFVYYVIVLLLRLGSVFVYYIASPTLILLICYFEYALTSVVTSRSILAFRRVLSDTLSAGPDDKVAVTTPQFQTRHTAASATTNNTGNRQ
ncbi:hypothetical protein FRC15_004730, partial [Serendipita sp. 397]